MSEAIRRRSSPVSGPMCRDVDKTPQCLGYTKSGQPRHPLMLSNDTPLERFEQHKAVV